MSAKLGVTVLCATALVIAIALPGSAFALDCSGWNRLDDDQKTASIEGMIQGHVFSDYGTKFTSEHRMAMKRCVQGFLSRIHDEFDDTCSRSASRDAIDDVFDRYFLSCVQ